MAKHSSPITGDVDYADLDANTKCFTVEVRTVADAAAGDTWERATYHARAAVIVRAVGIVPDVAFGQATNYANIEVQNKGIDGTGVTQLVIKAFSSAVAAYDYTSFGAIANASVSAGQVLSFKKTIAGTGQIVPASLLILDLERAA